MKIDKELAVLQNIIDKLELNNCEAQHKIDQLKETICQLEEEKPNKKSKKTNQWERLTK